MPPKNNVNPDLDPVIANPCNRVCADCDAKAPRWASVNLGILVCIDCSGAHRNLGTHISVVKSVTLDKWQAKWIATVGKIGNTLANDFFEDRLDSSDKPRGRLLGEEGRLHPEEVRAQVLRAQERHPAPRAPRP
eukprot:CAMPEP_0176328710 /NCGR_PEP_ID=MMETSP0121_2-20121125/75099_1 /TAXON_ID=160619 /ORGANISM="Kryptoperidinium foliaceum, Strain CCMP 1326" /LENGTH=133 /DNA_ID=CAMNT_0017671381 /DNA_START=28 /DNA_END=425 /DNA_ORIENTATION=+